MNLLFYDQTKDEIVSIPQNPNHKSYLLTRDEKLPRTKKIIGVEGITKRDSLRNRNSIFRKVFTNIPTHIADIRSMFKTHWEDRILYHLCYVYDELLIYGCDHIFPFENEPIPYLNIKSDTALAPNVEVLEKFYEQIFEMPFVNYKRCAFDIEVRVKRGERPNVRQADKPVIAISLIGTDSFSKIYLLAEEKKQVGNMFFYNSEKEMIEDFFNDVERYPVRLTHGGDILDMPYLKNRAKKLGIKKIPIIPKREYLSFENSIHIDTSLFFGNSSIRTYVFDNKYDSAKLGELSQIFLGKKKLEMPDLEKANPEEIGVYCWNDALLCLELTTFNNNLVMNLMTTLSRIINMDIETALRGNVSSWAGSYHNFIHRLLGFLIPSPEDLERFNPKDLDEITYRGAIILDPVLLGTVGSHFDVWTMDFSSLYLGCVVERNIGYDTVQCKHEGCRKNKVPNWDFDSEGNLVKKGYFDIHICKEKQGIFPIMIAVLKNLRVNKYKPMLKEEKDGVKRSWLEAIVGMQKFILLVSYGVCGSSKIKDLFVYPAIRSITAYGRQALSTAIEEARKMGGVVIAGHTDSLYLKGLTKEQVEELSRTVSEKLNIEFAIQKHYKFVSNWRKANYLKVDDNGKVEVTGMLGKKRHIPRFIKEKFEGVKEILSKVEDESSLEKAKKQIVHLVSEAKTQIVKNGVPLKELAFDVTLHRPIEEGHGQFYNCARMVKENIDENITRGDTIDIILTNGEHTAMPLQMVAEMLSDISSPTKMLNRSKIINKQKYVEHLKSVLGQCVSPLGMSVSSSINGLEETKLSKWFGVE